MDIYNRPLREIYTPLPGPPEVERPNPEIYARMGEANIFRMLEDFYAELERSAIRHLFAGDMKASSRKSAEFFVGLLGGPPLYQQRHGHPRLRMRHIPFRIDDAARREWLRCFDRILDRSTRDYDFPSEHLEGFRRWLHVFSQWMINTRTRAQETTNRGSRQGLSG